MFPFLSAWVCVCVCALQVKHQQKSAPFSPFPYGYWVSACLSAKYGLRLQL